MINRSSQEFLITPMKMKCPAVRSNLRSSSCHGRDDNDRDLKGMVTQCSALTITPHRTEKPLTGSKVEGG
jgi:hypothetical protein